MSAPASASFTPDRTKAFTENMARVAERSQRALAELARIQRDPVGAGTDLTRVALEATAQLLGNPEGNIGAQVQLWQDLARAWGGALFPSAEPSTPPPTDRRFRDPAWSEHPLFRSLRDSYLVLADWMNDRVQAIPELDPHAAHVLRFYTKQFVDAMAPSNFLFTNPEVLRTTIESDGENLVRGLDHLLEDIERGNGDLLVKMTDYDAFEVGRNVAVTPGKVVYQNDIMQLIQYEPATEAVHRRPLLIIPPWINKYYILDLRPENSYVRWCVEQGYTVFMLSWVNPDERLAEKTYADYMFEGPLAALDAIEAATAQREVNAVGYCVGGTLLTTALAYMQATGDHRIKSATLFAAQVDFSEPGDLGVFIDEPQLTTLERRMAASGGLLDGAAMASTFNSLRANDLIWSFAVNNYLLGREPLPFDLLYWNADATRIPAPLHSYYLRNMYQQNLLVSPGALEVSGVPIDLRTIRVPLYIQAAQDDHIAPFPSVFKATRHVAGPLRFILAGSGHIAGVVNPPSAKKYSYWTNARVRRSATAEAWLRGAEQHPGSWWPDWEAWLAQRSGKDVPARVPGAGGLPVIEAAPGSFVLQRADCAAAAPSQSA